MRPSRFGSVDGSAALPVRLLEVSIPNVKARRDRSLRAQVDYVFEMIHVSIVTAALSSIGDAESSSRESPRRTTTWLLLSARQIITSLMHVVTSIDEINDRVLPSLAGIPVSRCGFMGATDPLPFQVPNATAALPVFALWLFDTRNGRDRERAVHMHS